MKKEVLIIIAVGVLSSTTQAVELDFSAKVNYVAEKTGFTTEIETIKAKEGFKKESHIHLPYGAYGLYNLTFSEQNGDLRLLITSNEKEKPKKGWLYSSKSPNSCHEITYTETKIGVNTDYKLHKKGKGLEKCEKILNSI